MRAKLVHAYDDIDVALIGRVAAFDLWELVALIERILSEEVR